MQVPLLDLKAQNRTIKSETENAIARVVESQYFIMGHEVENLEKSIENFCSGRIKALGVSSGTDAIVLALMALGIGVGDEVITTPYTFFATAGSVARLGAKPVFVDVCPDTLNINPELIEKAITPRTKVIIPVHLFGQMADMDPIMDIARKYNLMVIEDAAQAIGAKYNGRMACTIGDIGILSFFPSKNLGGFGDGGMVLTKDDALYEKMKLLRVHGAGSQYVHKYVGGNFRLDALQAAVLSVKLPYLNGWTDKRRNNAEYYNRRFYGTGIEALVVRSENFSVYNQFVVNVCNRDNLVDYLKKREIGCAVYYPLPLHLQECFSSLGYREGDLPCSEKASKRTLALPIYPELTDEQLDFVATTVLEFYR